MEDDCLCIQAFHAVRLEPFQGTSPEIRFGLSDDKGFNGLSVFVGNLGCQSTFEQCFAVSRTTLLRRHSTCTLRRIRLHIPRAAVTSKHNSIFQTIREDGAGNCDTRNDSGALQLLHNRFVLHHQGFFGAVWLDAPNITRTSLTQGNHEIRQLRLVLGPDGRRHNVASLSWSVGCHWCQRRSFDDKIVALGGTTLQIGRKRVLITVDKELPIIHDLSSVVRNAKRHAVRAIHQETGGGLVLLESLLDEIEVISLGADAFFVQHGKQARTTLNQVHNLGIVVVFDLRQGDTFIFVFLHDTAEDIFGELLLKFFVGIINTKLFEPIHCKGFKAKNVEESDGSVVCTRVLLDSRRFVDGIDEPQEDLLVRFFSQCIAGFFGGLGVQWNLVRLFTRLHGAFRKGCDEILLSYVHQLGQGTKLLRSGHDGAIGITRIRGETNVSELHHHTDSLHKRGHLVACDINFTKRLERLLEAVSVLHSFNGVRVGWTHVGKVFLCSTDQTAPELTLDLVRRGKKLIEDVEGTFVILVSHHTVLFQKVNFALAAHEFATTASHVAAHSLFKLELQILAKARRVIIASGLGIAKSFQERVGINDALDNRVKATAFVVVHLALLCTGNVIETDLDGFRFASARFTRHQNGLILVVHGQATVRECRDFVNMGFHATSWIRLGRLPHEAIRVIRAFLLGIQLIVPLVGIDGNHDISRASIGLFLHVTLFQVIENGGLQQEKVKHMRR